MDFIEYKIWIGGRAITKAQWEQMCVPGKQLQLFEPDYALFQQIEGRLNFGKTYQTRKEDSIVSVICGSKLTQEELDKLHNFIGPRPTAAWNVTMKRNNIDEEPFNARVYAGPDGIMNNGGSGDAHSRFMLLDIELPSMDAIFYDE